MDGWLETGMDDFFGVCSLFGPSLPSTVYGFALLDALPVLVHSFGRLVTWTNASLYRNRLDTHSLYPNVPAPVP